jgi:hypothetical protein
MTKVHQLIVSVPFLFIASASAQNQGADKKKQDMEQYAYRYFEGDLKKEFAGALAEIKRHTIEDNLPQEASNVFIGLTKMFIYNKANIYATCFGYVLSKLPSFSLTDPVPPDLQAELEDCLNRRNSKFRTLSTILFQYALTAVTPRAFVQCELKARLFEREQMPPPYDFLQKASGQDMAGKLLDPETFNQCIIAGAK